jgi:signal transduction histidine kinase
LDQRPPVLDQRPPVLVVDDEALNRSLIRASLAGFCDVIEAVSGPAALEILKQRPVELVLLDVMMPGMNGYDVCKAIKEQASEFLPVILVTALGEQGDRNRGLEAGADDFLTKPVDRRELTLRTRAFLRLREQDKVIRRQLGELQRLQAAKDDLVALLVHDLRSPLAGVIAHLQLLAEDVTGRAAGDVQQAMRAAETALQRLEETLQVRLIEEGQLTVRREQVTLDALVRDSLSPLESIARRRNVQLSRTVEGAPLAPLDASLVRRSLENLVSNALKYTPGGGDVLVSLRAEDGKVAIEVSDRGPGIPDDQKSSMFEKFGSVEAKQGGKRKGIGLGLYLVKLVAEGHGGAVSVEDRPGGGSVFRLVLGTS